MPRHPVIGKTKTKPYNITIPPETAESLRGHGGGNLSAGVRKGDEALNAKKRPVKKPA